jgi:hypothetical protein
MATTNHDRVGKALDLLKAGLGPFAERELAHTYHAKAASQAALFLGDDRLLANKPLTQWDAAALRKLMWEAWNAVFRKTWGQSERSLVQELREVRNRCAHQHTFSTDDTYRALDSAARLLTAVSAPQADDIEKMKLELLRLRFDEQVRSERRRTTAGGSGNRHNRRRGRKFDRWSRDEDRQHGHRGAPRICRRAKASPLPWQRDA